MAAVIKEEYLNIANVRSVDEVKFAAVGKSAGVRIASAAEEAEVEKA